MGMPDKIRIIGVERNKNGAFGNWTTRPFNGEVYIRKDALLEWAKEKIEWYDGTEISEVYQKVVDKLNSM